MKTPLYTVTIDFEDHSRAIFQTQARSERAALDRALLESEAMAEYDRVLTESMIDNDRLSLTHLAMGYRGTWLWHPVRGAQNGWQSILGGIIVQTSQDGPVRKQHV